MPGRYIRHSRASSLRHAAFVALRGVWRLAKHLLPRELRRRIEASPAALRIRHGVGPTKYEAELGFWRNEFDKSGGDLRNDEYYRGIIRRVGRLYDDRLFEGKVVVDIGCGPRGSLCWISNARLAIGIDPLADAYRPLGIARQPMRYVAACGERLPLADASVDVAVTINALDHVDDPVAVMREIRRVVRPGGCVIASINLREVPTATEPCVIREADVRAHLLAVWQVEYEHIFPECDAPNDAYRYADRAPPAGFVPNMYVLWCRAMRPSAAAATES